MKPPICRTSLSSNGELPAGTATTERTGAAWDWLLGLI